MADEQRTPPEPLKFKGFKLSVTFTDPEEAEHFLRGLILARQNNSSEYFVSLIDDLNGAMEKYRAEKLKRDMEIRAWHGMP